MFVEDLDVKEMLEADGNARTTHYVGWRGFIQILKHHGEKNGCYVVEVDPAGTTKECHECGVEVEKPLWVREHAWPSCGFTADRDLNAAFNVLERGFDELGVVHSEVTTSVETAAAADTDSVAARRVVEAGSRALKEPLVGE
nr:zinc ribbon domain-containing protein [Salarchaeum sp. JOR-1]